MRFILGLRKISVNQVRDITLWGGDNRRGADEFGGGGEVTSKWVFSDYLIEWVFSDYSIENE